MAGPSDNLVPEGLSRGSTVDPFEQAKVGQLKLQAAKALQELTGEYAFYTPALLHVFGQLPFDPLTDFQRDVRRDVASFSVRFNLPIFRGLAVPDDASWNHVLYAMPREDWPDYLHWLRGVAVLDRAKGCLTKVRVTPIQILDPVAHDYRVGDQPRFVEIHYIGLESNHGSHYLTNPAGNPLAKPQAMWMSQAYRDTCALAEALLSGTDIPLEDIQLPEGGVLKMPEAVGWDSLSPAKQQELREALDEAARYFQGMTP